MTALRDLVVEPLTAAFLDVGVFVAPLLLAFGWLQWRTGGRLVAFLAGHRRLGPLIGAGLGVMPGCGGAIVIMPLYLRGSVSFGAAVAALVATMGDSSFVLIAADPVLAVGVHGLLFAAGGVVGSVVDALGVAPAPAGATRVRPPVTAGAHPHGEPVVAGVGAAVAPTVPCGPARLLLSAFWTLVVVGLAIAVPLAAGFTDGPTLATLAGGIDLRLLVGAAGGVCALGLLAVGRWNRSSGSGTGAQRILADSARESAFVLLWVAVAFAVTAAVVGATGLSVLNGESQAGLLRGSAGLVAVLVGALVGLVPGCGPQLVLTGLYVQGALPFSVLVANALSQDGDALIPLLAGHRRAALLATAITTLPGILVGVAFWAVGR